MQVYYVGLLAGENDVDLVERTLVGPDINRHAYTREEIERSLSRPVVKQLFSLMRFRNSYLAFDGTCDVQEEGPDENLQIEWQHGVSTAALHADLKRRSYVITYFEPGLDRRVQLADVWGDN